MIHKIVLLSGILILCQLFSGCAIPLAFMGLYSVANENQSDNIQVAPDEEDAFRREDYSIGIVLENAEDFNESYLIAGEYNSLRIYVPENINPMNIILSSSAGKM